MEYKPISLEKFLLSTTHLMSLLSALLLLQGISRTFIANATKDKLQASKQTDRQRGRQIGREREREGDRPVFLCFSCYHSTQVAFDKCIYDFRNSFLHFVADFYGDILKMLTLKILCRFPLSLSSFCLSLSR